MGKFPLIGITSGEIRSKDDSWAPVIYGQSQTYVNAVRRAGGIPVIVPLLQHPEELWGLYDALDGILFAGGNDVSPHMYGEEPYPTTKDVSVFRDQTETQLMEWALADDKPMLCICRGMQLLNVMQGGSLYQDIHKDLADTLDHNASTKKQTLEDTSHILHIDEHSRLAAILGTTNIGTNAHHHQAIRSIGKGIVAVAWTEDKVIEAIEMPHMKYVMGVQSHPESLEARAEPLWQKLFASFVDSAQS